MSRITELFERYYNKTASVSERKELMELIAADVNSDELRIAEKNAWEQLGAEEKVYTINESELIFGQILETRAADPSHALFPVPSAPRVDFLRRPWLRYAAAAIILLGIGAITFVVSFHRKHSPSKKDAMVASADIPPGGQKAVLTLADGNKIVLDSAANGNLAQQGNAAVVKLADGRIAYNLKGSAEGDVMMNTMVTPRGGQYQIVLPDGTKVWMNAASSITYPVAFVGKERRITVTGEVYLEVAKNSKQPFSVNVNGATIEVLGTSFNVNAYGDQSTLNTTLIGGSVRVIANESVSRQGVMLKPGQQAEIPTGRDRDITVNDSADIDQVLAWKNGLFNFKGVRLSSMTKQLERWYDITIELEGDPDDMLMNGKMDRGVQLSGIIRFFQSYGFETKLDGRKLTVVRK